MKYSFFRQKLFKDIKVFPRFKLEIELNADVINTKRKIEDYFKIIEDAFYRLDGKYFSSKDLLKELNPVLKNEILARRISNLILNLYSAPSDFIRSGRQLKFDTFIQTKRGERGENIYRVVDSAYLKVKKYIFRKFGIMFYDRHEVYKKYISIDNKDSEWEIKIAYLIESLLLGSYELTGGKLPQIFIRINDPYKIRLLSKYKEYTNELLQDIDDRHKDSMQIMEYFFTLQMDNQSRWDFIEQYFLGKIDASHLE